MHPDDLAEPETAEAQCPSAAATHTGHDCHCDDRQARHHVTPALVSDPYEAAAGALAVLDLEHGGKQLLGPGRKHAATADPDSPP